MRPLDVVTIGETMGLLTPSSPGPLPHAPAVRLSIGGAESNVAIGVSRLGGTSGWVGRVGDDGIGELVSREIRAEGVEVHASVDPTAATAFMLKERPRVGRSRVTYYRATQAGSRITPEDIPAGLIERGRILHVTGISAALGAGPLRTLHAAIDRARAAGTRVSFDVNHRSALWTSSETASEIYRNIIERVDILFAGDDEAALVTGATQPGAQLAELKNMGPDCVVVKRGSEGAVAADAAEHLESAAIPVSVVDTVGAGDAFVAGWLAETALGASLADRMNTALMCGAITCTSAGDWEGAPRRSDLDDLRSPGSDPVQR